MKIFLSHASEHKGTARPVCSGLRAAGFEVFFDETNLPPGAAYDDRIRQAIECSDLFIFMLSPEAVTPGRYTLTELLFAAQRWPSPLGHVLAVLPLDSPQPALPDYLKPLTLQKQVGNLAAEVLATVQQMKSELAATAAPPPPPTASSEPGAAAYHSLNIRLRRGPADALGYTLQLAGVAQSDPTSLPPGTDHAALEPILWAGARRVQGVSRRGVPGPMALGKLPTAEAVREVGGRLHALLFAPPLNGLLQGPLRGIDRQRGQGLRFVIDATDAPGLARLPWEFTFDPRRGDFLFTDTMKPVVRWLDIDETTPTLRIEPPLRLLIAVASPSDRAALAVGDELAHLDRALSDLTTQGLLHTEVLERASLQRLEEALLRVRPHVLHFVGHGDFAGDEGTVVFEREVENGSDELHGPAAPVTGQRLAVLLRAHLASLRLLFLNSCMGAAASARNPFGGVAQALVGHGVPAVIAMQFPIPDASAVALARHFYRYLAAGRPVDESLTAARAFLYAQGSEVEWGAPVLTMRSPDGRLFDLPARQMGSPPVALSPSPVGRPPTPAAVDSSPAQVGPAGPVLSSSARPAGRWLALAAVVLLVALAAWWFLQKSSGSIDQPSIVSPVPVPVPAPAPAPVAASTEMARATADALSQARASRLAGDRDAAVAALGAAAERLKQVPLSADAQTLSSDFRSEMLLLAERASAEELASLLRAAQSAADPRLPATEQLVAALLSGVAPGVVPGPVEVPTHTVHRGETLWSIAGKRYGDPRRWPAIAQANASIVPDPAAIRPGQVLRIPPHPSTRADAAYQVRPGDSLWRIAARLYGDGALWPRIHGANLQRIADPQRIEPGQSLRIPAAR